MLQTIKLKKFGRLTIIRETTRNRFSQRRVICRCDCGNEIVARWGSITYGYTRSCGCLRKEQAVKNSTYTVTHGMSFSKEFWIWRSMKARCSNPKNASYHRYGGRGIRVCRRWEQFANFFADMGKCPKGLMIERKDNDGNYTPENCCWATPQQQQRNRSNNRLIERDGVRKTIREWSEILGLKLGTIAGRLYNAKYPESRLLDPPHQGVKP